MNRHLLSLATLCTLAMLPVSPPSFATGAEESTAAPARPFVAQTTRFGALDVPPSVVDAAAWTRLVRAGGADFAPALPLLAPTVLVVGGTPAGVAAAIAAARHGARVVLVNASPELGGVLADAMMDQWDLNRTSAGRSIEGGIFPEMYARLGDAFSPSEASHVFSTMVAAEPRIRVLASSEPVRVETAAAGSSRAIRDVVVRDERSGTLATLAADAVVDATDDGDVVAEAGARYDVGRQDTGIDERMQSVTLMFAMSGVDWPTVRRTYRIDAFGPGGANASRAWGYAKVARAYRPADPNAVVRDFNFGRRRDGIVTVNAVDLCDVDALSPADRARAYELAKAESYALVAHLRAHLPGFARGRIESFARRLYVRETRHIVGLERITTGDIWQERVPSDTIGLSSYPIDSHAVVPAQVPAYATVRHVYGIPFGALTPVGFANVVMASPAISATHLASGSARVVPTTVEEGEAAGVAAALAARDGVDVRTIARDPVRMASLREALRADGAILTVPPHAATAVATDRAVTSPHTWELLAAPG